MYQSFDLNRPAGSIGLSRTVRDFLECTSDCVFVLDSRWRFTFLNRRASQEIAREGQNLVGEVIWNAYPETAGTLFEENYRRAVDRNEEIVFESFYEPLSAWYEVRASPIEGGGLGVWFRNVNDRRAWAADLIAADERFRLASMATQDLIFDWDVATGRLEWQDASNDFLGYTREQFGSDVAWLMSCAHPEDRHHLETYAWQVVRGSGNQFAFEYRTLKKDGSYANVLTRGYLTRSADGRAVRMVGAVQDNTERNAAVRALSEREAHLSSVFGQAMVGIMHRAADGRLIMVNDRFCQIIGRSREELSSLNFADYTHPDDRVWNVPLFERSKQTGEPIHIEKRYVRPDGSAVWCEVNVSFVVGDNPSTIVVAQDITAKKATEVALRENELLYRSVIEASADSIVILDLDGAIKLANTPALDSFGCHSQSQLVGSLWPDKWPEGSRKAVRIALAKARGGSAARFTLTTTPGEAKSRWWDVVISPMCDDHGKPTGLLAIARDTTLQRETSAKLQWASEHDALTGLPNRRAFQDRLQAATLRAMTSDGSLGLLLIDLDHFKHVNDTLGHTAGDHLLAVLGQRLKDGLRPQDFVARLGGDEFAVILEGISREEEVALAGARLLSRLEEPIGFEGRVLSANASVGGAIFPQLASNANELFDNADIALYALKNSGRGGIKIFEQPMRDRAQLISTQLTLARVSITERAIEPYYQQKVGLTSGRIAGFEALLRWSHSHRGVQLPASIAEAFKDFELASRISDLMQQRVFADINAWVARKLDFGRVSINAAPVEFLRDDFAERMISRMQKYEVSPDLVELEVTEHVFFESGSAYVGRALQKLHAAGVTIALDDFGTGYSSLSHLRDFPVDVVKIDRSFIAGMSNNPEMMAIVSAVIDLAASLKIEVVAEGIETEDQQQLLVGKGCPLGQGFLFGKAMTASQVVSLLATSRGAVPLGVPRFKGSAPQGLLLH